MGRRQWFLKGLKDGIPISLGYFAVSLTLGISAKNAGLTAFQATFTSFLINASAGEFIGFSLIAANVGYLELIIMEAVANARYLLMSCALSQKLNKDTPLAQKLIMGFGVTDEVFGVSVAVEGKLDQFYTFGVIITALPGWSVGTLCGVMLGNVLPSRLVSALSVGLYGMFIAVFVPQAKKSKIIGAVVAVSFALSFIFAKLPLLANISAGIKIIILTVVISLGAAILFPVKEENANAA